MMSAHMFQQELVSYRWQHRHQLVINKCQSNGHDFMSYECQPDTSSNQCQTTILALMFQQKPNYYLAVIKEESLYQLVYFRYLMLRSIDLITSFMLIYLMYAFIRLAMIDIMYLSYLQHMFTVQFKLKVCIKRLTWIDINIVNPIIIYILYFMNLYVILYYVLYAMCLFVYCVYVF